MSEKWKLSGACREVDPDMFFAEPGTRHRADAQAMCRNLCPVQAACLKYALDNNIEDGVWGGTTPGARAKLKAGR